MNVLSNTETKLWACWCKVLFSGCVKMKSSDTDLQKHKNGEDQMLQLLTYCLEKRTSKKEEFCATKLRWVGALEYGLLSPNVGANV